MPNYTDNFDLVKPTYNETADISVINGNMGLIDRTENGLSKGIAIVAKNNTHAAITQGQYVYVHGSSSVYEGLYTARADIAQDAALSSDNLLVANGALNTVKSNIDSIVSNIPYKVITKTASAAGRSYLNFTDPGQHFIVITTASDIVTMILTVVVASNMNTLAYIHSKKNMDVYEMGVTAGRFTVSADQGGRILNILDFRIAGSGFVF